MIREIHLHGPLATKFGTEPIGFDADNVQMLFRGLSSVYPDFMIELRKHNQMAIALKKGDDVSFLDEQGLQWSFGDKEEIHIATSEEGSGELAAAAILNTTFAAATGWTAVAYVAIAIAVNIAISYAVGRISQSLADKPSGARAETDERKSALFDQAVNLQGQGHPVPLVYGRFKVGSVVISSDVTTEKNAIAVGEGISIEQGQSYSGNVFDNDIDGTSLTLDNFVVDGVTKTPGQTHTGDGFTVTINSNGTFNVTTSTFIGLKEVFYTATSSVTGSDTTATLSIQVLAPYVYYYESTGGDGSGGGSGGY